MKWGFFLYLSLVLLFSSCSTNERVPQSINREQTLHVVFDIDWTIVSNFESDFSEAPVDRVVEVEGKKYVLRDGLENLIEYLLDENIKVSFFSGGTKSRNEELLSKIILHDGRSLKEVAFKIKSMEDLTTVAGVAETAKFQERFKKDMTKISKDLKNLIWFDDGNNFYISELQRNNLIHIGPSFKYFETYDQAIKFNGNYIPSNFNQYQFDRKKMEVIRENIQEALKLVDEEKVTFEEAVNLVAKKIDYASGLYNPYSRNLTMKPTIKINRPNISRPCSEYLIPFLK